MRKPVRPTRKLLAGAGAALAIIVALWLTLGRSGAPDADDVRQWWARKYDESIALAGPIEAVTLVGGRRAYLAQVSFEDRGRNFMQRAVLIRPDLREVRELAFPFGVKSTVTDIDGDGISEILTRAGGTGQGASTWTDAVVRIDEWKPQVLYSVQTGDNFGNCGVGMQKCAGDEVRWRFERTDSGVLLVETYVRQSGPDADSLDSKEAERRYVLAGDSFRPAAHSAKTAAPR